MTRFDKAALTITMILVIITVHAIVSPQGLEFIMEVLR